MGQLADRLGEVLRGYGWEPQARGSELAALASLEAQDPKAAHARFLELRRAFADQRRAEVLARLRAFPFVVGLPPPGTQGMGLKEVESEIRACERALALAREAEAALREAAEARARLATRRAPEVAVPERAPWDRLGPLAEAAEAARRAVLREARVEERAAELARRARRAGFEPPDVGSLPVHEADARLDALSGRLAEAESLEDAHARAVRPLGDEAVRAWRATTAKALRREAEEARSRGDHAALADIAARAETLRADAAALEREAARARRSGRPPPSREARAGDAMDPYG